MSKKYDVLEITDKITIKGDFYSNGDVYLGKSGSKIGFFGITPIVQQELADETSIDDLITILKNYGLLGS